MRAQDSVLVLAEDAEEYRRALAPLIAEGVEVHFHTDTRPLSEAAQSAEAWLAQPALAAALIDRYPQVRWVQSTWAGITPLLKTQRSGYLLSGVRGVFGPQMVEYVFGHLLAIELRIGERVRAQHRREFWRKPSRSLQGKTLGVLGTGSIGQSLAQAARTFGLHCLGLSRSGAPQSAFDQVFAAGQLHEFLGACDYVVGVLPHTPATTHLLDEAALRSMRPDAVLLNVGRGNLIDEMALVQVLQSGHLRAVVLDVFETEPLPAESALWELPNVLVTGHTAALSPPADIAQLFIRNYQRFCRGETLENLVDRQRNY